MRRVWLIKAGEQTDQIDAMRRAGLIGIRYETVGNLRELNPAEIEQGIIDAGRGTVIAAQRSMLHQFANEVRPGDLVVSPNPARHEVWVGTVAGEYRHTDADNAQVSGFQHTRNVEWLGWLDRDSALMRDQLLSLERPPVLYELPSREWWWRQYDAARFTLQPRTAWSTTPAKRTRAAGSTSSTPRQPRAPRVATPKPPARKAPVAMVRCAGSCGFLWAPTSLVDGLCADCRND